MCRMLFLSVKISISLWHAVTQCGGDSWIGLNDFSIKIKVWLPPNITWKDIEPGSRDDIVYADYRHLLWPIPISFVIILIRFTVERWGQNRLSTDICLVTLMFIELERKHRKHDASDSKNNLFRGTESVLLMPKLLSEVAKQTFSNLSLSE